VCGRFVSSASIDQIRTLFEVEKAKIADDDYEPHYNVAPTMEVPAVADVAGQRTLGLMFWGYAPERFQRGNPRNTINARSETAATSGYFRSSLAKRRCLIPANGFFEWQNVGAVKVPHLFQPADGTLFAFGAIWAPRSKSSEDAPAAGFAVLTTAPNEIVGAIHDRMPVILPRDHWDFWLDPAMDDPRIAQQLCVPLPSADIVSVEVGRRVNDVRNDDPDCVLPVPARSPGAPPGEPRNEQVGGRLW